MFNGQIEPNRLETPSTDADLCSTADGDIAASKLFGAQENIMISVFVNDMFAGKCI
jgi:hypothetical protein